MVHMPWGNRHDVVECMTYKKNKGRVALKPSMDRQYTILATSKNKYGVYQWQERK